MEINDKLLIVDDDKELLKVYQRVFEHNHFDVITTADSLQAVELIKQENIGVVISDIIMPRLDGMALLNKIMEVDPTIQVIMLTAEGSIDGAVQAVKTGAFTYLMKPAAINDILLDVQKAFELYAIKNENKYLKQRVMEDVGMHVLIGQNKKIQEIKNKIVTIAETDATVLITGESGTGKEIVANQLHYYSKRKNHSFIKVNCAALTESLLESELFGHEQGSFTGATRTHKGKFEAANNGTLLLDEIGEMSLGTQATLLRVLQEKEFERVGGGDLIKTDFRLIAATNKNLKEEVEKGNFREDLFYRINVLPVDMPPLRDRKDDIGLLANNWISRISKEMDRPFNPLSPEVLRIFCQYDWPGNVRELFNVVERLVIMIKGSEIQAIDLLENFTNDLGIEGDDDVAEGNTNSGQSCTTLTDAKKSFEKEFLIQALERNQYNILKTSEEIQLARKNLYKKIKEHGITM